MDSSFFDFLSGSPSLQNYLERKILSQPSQECFQRHYSVRVTRCVQIPDDYKIARYERIPELGPRICFLTGGTALRELSKKLVRFTHNSVHIVTPFDSGGSSAVLRRHFHIIAVGDLRNRLMALADQSVHCQADLCNLFARRLSESFDCEIGRSEAIEDLKSQLSSFVNKTHPDIQILQEPMREIVCSYLRAFQESIPEDFDLRGSAIGNLVIVGGLIKHNFSIDSVLFVFSRIINVRGIVKPTAKEDLHLAFELQSGQTIVGQHRVTAKECDPLNSPIKRMFLTSQTPDSPSSENAPEVSEVSLTSDLISLINNCELMVFPMGSFFTSVACHFLVRGMGSTIYNKECPKIFVPNSDLKDPEQTHLLLSDSVWTLLDLMASDLDAHARTQVDEEQLFSRFISHVIIDSRSGLYQCGSDGIEAEIKRIEGWGVQVLDLSIVSPIDHLFDPELLCKTLLSFT